MRKTKMSLIVAMILANTAISINLHADYLETAKAYGEKVKFWKDEPMKYNFKDIYPKEFYKKSYFAPTAIAVSIAGGVAFSYFTAGTGAPTAAAGVSTVASMVAGGGAGSYLAGLATVGSWFGGGMVLGGAILNGIVIGSAVGGTLTLGSMTALQVIEASSLMTAMSMDGIAYFKNPETGKNEYRVRLEIPKDIGSKEVRQIVENYYEANEALIDTIQNGDHTKQTASDVAIKLYTNAAVKLLEQKITDNNLSSDDSVVLSVIAWRNGSFDAFEKGMLQIEKLDTKNKSFTDYLMALKYLKNSDIDNALLYLHKSIESNDYTLEPIILKINILSNLDFAKHEIEIAELVKSATDNFDSDKYATFLNLTSLYYRVGTIYFVNKKYAQANEYFQKAYDELGFLQKKFFGKELKHTINLAIANSLYSDGKKIEADKVYALIIGDIDEKESGEELKKIKDSYLGANKTAK